MKEFIKNNKGIVGAGGVVALAIVAFLAFGVFGIHTAFIDDEVSEAGPVFASGVTADGSTGSNEPASSDGTDTDSTDTDTDATDDSDAAAGNDPETPVVQTLATGAFADSAIHSGTGDAVVLSDGNQTFLRFEENFATDNGPDLNVYLRNPDNPDDYIDLGDLKGNIGSQNYELPAGTDISVYSEIDIWCVRFGVSFADALLTVA